MPGRWVFGRPLMAVLGLVVVTAPWSWADNEVSEARMRRDINFLASDECEGRGPGTKGIDKAAAYIASEFQKAGLKPGGDDGGYFQPFTVTRAEDAKLGKNNVLRL